jgi:beta-hydroxyacyl-ACP dehydratase FabZ
MVDRILELEKGVRVVGLKNVTMNEPFFQGHYPGHPVMPGVMIVEAMAQVAGFMILGEENTGKIPLFTSIDGFKFRRPVVPGDQLRIEAEMLKQRRSLAKVYCRALVNEEIVAEGELMFTVVDEV